MTRKLNEIGKLCSFNLICNTVKLRSMHWKFWTIECLAHHPHHKLKEITPPKTRSHTLNHPPKWPWSLHKIAQGKNTKNESRFKSRLAWWTINQNWPPQGKTAANLQFRPQIFRRLSRIANQWCKVRAVIAISCRTARYKAHNRDKNWVTLVRL